MKEKYYEYRQSPYPWATLTDGGPPFFPAAWPAQLCHQGSNSLLPKQVAYCLSKCLGPPGNFTRAPWHFGNFSEGLRGCETYKLAIISWSHISLSWGSHWNSLVMAILTFKTSFIHLGLSEAPTRLYRSASQAKTASGKNPQCID